MNLACFLVCKSLEPEEAEDYVLKSITTAQFWNHMHKRASSTPTGEARYVFYHPFINRHFPSFDAVRRRPDTRGSMNNKVKMIAKIMLILEHLYEILSITPLHGSIASSYASKMCAKRLMKRIVDYMPLSGAEQQEFFGNNQEIINFYKYQHGNYFEYFYPMKEEKLTGTDTASIHSEIYLTYFKSLLTDINNYAKRLSLLPIASHQIVHVSIPSDTFYHLLKRAYTENYNVPDSVTKPQESLLKNNDYANFIFSLQIGGYIQCGKKNFGKNFST
ncbi:hypothetical protein RMCBS344292_05640 [Rhizopus microsporus]|nr:hypothetical protein RMCBS344292_05640 [Rhizopus microsporus]